MSVGPQGRSGKGGARLRRLSRRDRDGSVGEVWDGRREHVREDGRHPALDKSVVGHDERERGVLMWC
jgi:hypothetical protein